MVKIKSFQDCHTSEGTVRPQAVCWRDCQSSGAISGRRRCLCPQSCFQKGQPPLWDKTYQACRKASWSYCVHRSSGVIVGAQMPRSPHLAQDAVNIEHNTEERFRGRFIDPAGDAQLGRHRLRCRLGCAGQAGMGGRHSEAAKRYSTRWCSSLDKLVPKPICTACQTQLNCDASSCPLRED